MRVNLAIETDISRSIRTRQVEAMFDVPPEEKSKRHWEGEFPYDEEPWNVGLIVGPSGSGKTSIARHVFGHAFERPMAWKSKSVIDDVDSKKTVAEISEAFSAVGFNTIPAWLRPWSVLSNGERFRVDIARRLLELEDPIVVDEFTSVVDRQVAQVASHAVQKLVRKHNRKFVAVGCHYDVIDWLQPDWIFEPETMRFQRRLLRRRPAIEIDIRRCDYSLWQRFAPFHYLTAELNRSARCFALYVDRRPVVFAGMLPFPHPKVRDIVRLSRIVTLPDWQGLGLAFVMMEKLAMAYSAVGKRYRTYPAHPGFVRQFGRNDNWRQKKEAGTFSPHIGRTSSVKVTVGSEWAKTFGGRPCAVFEWRGCKMEDAGLARSFIEGAA